MRRRLLITYLSLTAVLLLALEVPLALSLAMNEFHHLAIAQVNDTEKLAAAASRTATPASDASWAARATSYGTHTHRTVLLLDAQGEIALSTRPGTAIERAEWRRTVRRALDGNPNLPLEYPFNLSAEPLLVAAPVFEHGWVIGAVVTISPTTSLRARALGQNALLLGVAAAGLLAAAAAAVPLSRWSLGPVRQLHRAVGAIAQGRYDTRASAESGPAEIRELAAAVNTMTDRLVALLEAQRSFVADASHQLRNPLSALRLRMDVLESAVTEAGRPHLEQAVEQAVEEAERLGRILDELLALAHASEADSGATPVEMRSVAEARARAWSPQAAATDVTIVVKGEQVVACCQPGILDQVLDVLLDNALGFSPAGGRITVRTWVDDTRARVTVTDEGPGMTAQDAERATDRFWRGEQIGNRSGSGLGLAIATTLLEVGGGRLSLSSAEPHGLVAEVDLARDIPGVAALTRSDAGGRS
ncbi:sensor histidine kinase [Streptomyces alanosinicus]|uniref:histidine kinase n=1 Tax=Streptomyces alanosinicus TaxID=68171 RepID=A0A919D4Q3_9ACTN|nr:HAMP domain-containing sensor histidine kinase [Streptomyces alanosinicus]GHE10247.1 two-component sensor histidine kinase [Streptomyces alanosinicus]